MLRYLKTALSDLRTWWNAPTTREDRRIAAVCGAIAGCVIGFIVRIVVGPIPAPWHEFAVWSAGGLIVGSVLGFAVPKPIMILSLPFLKILEGV